MSTFRDFELRILKPPDSGRPAGRRDDEPARPAEPSRAGDRDMLPGAPASPAAPRWASSYAVRARSTQGGECSGVFEFPFSAEEADRLADRAPDLDDGEIADLGVRLFRAAFADEVGALFAVTNREATRENAGLRIQLCLEPAELAELPWEILRPPDWAFAPAVSERVPMIRRIDLLAEPENLEVAGPIEVLLVASQPADQPGLDLGRERDEISRILKPLADCGKVRVTFERARRADVLEALRGGRHHIVHFMMHGGFDAAGRGGTLALEGPGGGTETLGAEELAISLYSNPAARTRVAIFNACRTAGDAVDRPGRGLAAAAVRLNLPAVVAMQYPISDPAAIVFAREFYARLAQGWGIDEAISFARYAICFERSADMRREWVTPVLYLRARGMHLFPCTDANYLDCTADRPAIDDLKTRIDAAPPGVTAEVIVTIRRQGADEGRFDVRLETPWKQAEASFELPAEYATPLVVPDPAGRERDPRAQALSHGADAVGEDLFARLFPGELADVLRDAIARTRARGQALRFSLVADDPALDRVPWECLRDPRTRLFLTLFGSQLPFLRRIEQPWAPALAPLAPPLRILFASCSPRDLAPLQLEREWEWLREAVGGTDEGLVLLDRLIDPTRDHLYEALSEGVHVLHFAGYDSFWASGGTLGAEGFVLLDENAHHDYVPTDDPREPACGPAVPAAGGRQHLPDGRPAGPVARAGRCPGGHRDAVRHPRRRGGAIHADLLQGPHGTRLGRRVGSGRVPQAPDPEAGSRRGIPRELDLSNPVHIGPRGGGPPTRVERLTPRVGETGPASAHGRLS